MNTLDDTRAQIAAAFSRISEFWGYPRAMGAIYAVLYLSPEPCSLDELVALAGVTKGAVSIHVRTLEQLGMVHKQIRPGERRDYYSAETDFWRISKGLLERRRNQDFDSALRAVASALDSVRTRSPQDARTRFYAERLAALNGFFRQLDSLVAIILRLDSLRQDGLAALVPARRKKS